MAIAKSELARPWPCLRVLTAIDALQRDQESAKATYVCVWSSAVHERAATDRGTFNHATQTLLARGFIERCYYTGEAKRKKGGYRITDAGRKALADGWTGKSGSQRTTMREASGVSVRVWRALRVRQKASLDELETLVGTGGEKALRSGIAKYVCALEKAGYLVRLGAARDRFLLARNSGPDAPLWRSRNGSVYDPNTGETHAIRGTP